MDNYPAYTFTYIHKLSKSKIITNLQYHEKIVLFKTFEHETKTCRYKWKSSVYAVKVESVLEELNLKRLLKIFICYSFEIHLIQATYLHTIT